MNDEVTNESLPRLVDQLADSDPTFGRLFELNGVPPSWRRGPSFATLVLFILEQQVSLASARAAYLRLHDAIGRMTPSNFLTLSDAELRSVGFSRQKTGYARGLATNMLDGSLELASLVARDDDVVLARLTAVRGIGRWTAGCYLLFVLGRPDAWPTGDRALYVSMRNVLDLDAVPDTSAADGMAESWRPLRAVAARMLWHDYLGGRQWEAPAVLPGLG